MTSEKLLLFSIRGYWGHSWRIWGQTECDLDTVEVILEDFEANLFTDFEVIEVNL